jgi:hypothetical protein
MPLDDAARSYASKIFQKEQENILKEQRKVLLNIRSDFAQRGMLSSGLFLSAYAKALLNQIQLLAESKRDSFLQAYKISNLPFDDAALQELSQEITVFCDGQQQHANAAIMQGTGQTLGEAGAPANVARALSTQVASETSGIKARILRDLSIMRDEAVLTARASETTKSAAEKHTETPPDELRRPVTPESAEFSTARVTPRWNHFSSWTIDQKIAAALLLVATLTFVGIFVVPEVRQRFGLEKRASQLPGNYAQPEKKPNSPVRSHKLLVAEIGKSVTDLRQRHGLNPLPQAESEKSLSEIPSNTYSFVSGYGVVSGKDSLPNLRTLGLSIDFEVHKLGDGTAIILAYVGPESLVHLQEGIPQGANVTLYSDTWSDAPNLVAINLSEITCDRDRSIYVSGRLLVTALDCKVK